MIHRTTVTLPGHAPEAIPRSSQRNRPGQSVPPNDPVDEALQPSAYFGFKYGIERGIAGLLLIPALPVTLALALLVRATSRGPAIYQQKRVGLNGRVFSIFKIRTMRVDAEAASGPMWSTSNDPRVTRLGRVLRMLHLDELPQLLNVVMGDMTIIGPRPERPEIVTVLLEQVEDYGDRLIVKPGITGLAQIYLPPDETINCVRKKVCVDRAYIREASPLVDLQIWLCTIVRIFGLRKGRGPRWFGLDRRFLDIVKYCAKYSDDADAAATASAFTAMRTDSAHALNGSSAGQSPNGAPVRPR